MTHEHRNDYKIPAEVLEHEGKAIMDELLSLIHADETDLPENFWYRAYQTTDSNNEPMVGIFCEWYDEDGHKTHVNLEADTINEDAHNLMSAFGWE